MNKSEQEYMNKLQTAYESVELENAQLKNQQGHISMFSNQGQEQNLIQYQLDMQEELERIDHLLRGHIIKRDDRGNEYWAEPEDDRLKPFNEYGVQLLLNIITFYLNRNTILSNYEEDMINWKIKDLGDEIADLIFMKYEEMGMNTVEKKKLYPMIVRQILDTIHSAYLRALEGGERESLRTARHVTQNDSAGNQMMTPIKPKFSPLRPSTWRG